jgi:hypothetical protein
MPAIPPGGDVRWFFPLMIGFAKADLQGGRGKSSEIIGRLYLHEELAL